MNIYFSGIGGVGISALLEIALDAGFKVQGSDLTESLSTQELAKRGVSMEVGNQDGRFLKACHLEQPLDWFIYTAALPPDHPELLVARELGIKTAKRDEFLNFFLGAKDLKLIAVTGSHGKTTTTGMLIWAFKQLGLPVSYAIGTTIHFGTIGHYDIDSQYFIYECDEFDRNFLHFSPELAVITSVDYDHPDTYPTVPEYKQAFREFLEKSSNIIIWQETAKYLDAPDDNRVWELGSGDVNPGIHLAGEHNRRNASLVLKTLERLDIGSAEQNIKTLNDFPGTDRRFERLADGLYSDYGHHPTEIAATLELASELSDHVVLVYQPHQNVRQHYLLGKYKDEFKRAEHIYWLPTYLTRENPKLEILPPELLYSTVSNRDSIESADLNDDLWQKVEAERAKGRLVLFMGAGSIDAWVRSNLVD